MKCARNVNTGLSVQAFIFQEQQVHASVFDIIGSTHQIEFFVGNKTDKMSRAVGQDIKS